MWILIAGLVIFFAVHLVRVVAGPWRERQIAANEGRWKGLYALASLAGLVLIIWGWVVFRPVAPQVYEPPQWGRYAAIVLTLLAFICLAAAYQPPGFIKVALKHPFLAGVMLWSIGHLLANGDLASVLLFGGFLAYAAIDRVAVIPRGDPAPAVMTWRGDVVALLAGAVVFAVVLWLHPWLFGVSPLG